MLAQNWLWLLAVKKQLQLLQLMFAFSFCRFEFNLCCTFIRCIKPLMKACNVDNTFFFDFQKT